MGEGGVVGGVYMVRVSLGSEGMRFGFESTGLLLERKREEFTNDVTTTQQTEILLDVCTLWVRMAKYRTRSRWSASICWKNMP